MGADGYCDDFSVCLRATFAVTLPRSSQHRDWRGIGGRPTEVTAWGCGHV